ncbi:MAG TPA: chromosomal replication initiator protein DnaA [Pyrinomonadaceae bacterium]|nr:chromosomal replication initiator protein DnaA [Pyrinomonadaceae bacterium]HQX54302.1 chromosomal replication initiator protein DnaA [Pyrinomonadaceae bacterium]HQY65788.1 chromosomal replication initiator protein DnaA [Pyrinomonadaceae bacterium]HRA39016.1 chromosomal replication initiator protein DnaA [Pyrinomonadaceae bacterium]
MELILEKNTVWDDILGLVRERLNPQIFDTWFLPIRFVELDPHSSELRLSAGDATIDWVVKFYSEILQESLKEINLSGYKIIWTAPDVEVVEAERPSSEELYFEPKPRPVIHGVTTNFRQLDPIDTTLNPKYTFDKFVVGSGNQFAHAAALGAAEAPGTTYNPLFIYGGVGLGKTHLMHAIGHSIRHRNSSLRVAYITSEKFMNELINAIRFDKTPAFRDKYRSIDVLLMDDVQFMAGKERTQEEFFHTFNTLHNNQKQIVISSDCPPREIPTLEERLHSRFEWGLIADIEPPDLETKVAILKRKADLDGFHLPDDIAIFMAGKIKSNVRELEGSLVRLVAIASLKGLPLSKMLAQEALKNIIDSEHPAGLTMDRISRTVASHYQMTVEELKSKSNSRAIAVPRQVAMYLCKKLTRHSFPEIGREFGGKHHTTVMHSVDKIETLTRDDRVFHKSVSELIDSLCS